MRTPLAAAALALALLGSAPPGAPAAAAQEGPAAIVPCVPCILPFPWGGEVSGAAETPPPAGAARLERFLAPAGRGALTADASGGIITVKATNGGDLVSTGMLKPK